MDTFEDMDKANQLIEILMNDGWMIFLKSKPTEET